MVSADTVRRGDDAMHILLIDWKNNGRFYCVLYSADQLNPYAEMWKTRELPDATLLSWTYSPRKRDDENERRKRRFAQHAGSLSVDVRLPTSGQDVARFLNQLFDLVVTRVWADDLQARGSPRLRSRRFTLPDEVAVYVEGATQRVVVNKYERDPEARQACIEHWGQKCSVCGLDFSERYGPEAAGLIHVHHLDALANTKSRRRVDPVKDLRPVCPNCHAVIHWAEPPHTIERVRAMLRGGASRGSSRSRATTR